MATFKVGQRVRKIAHGNLPWHRGVPIGTTGTILRTAQHFGAEWEMSYDGMPPPPLAYVANSDMLAPLIDPLADAFVERIKKIAREPITEKVKA